MADKKSKVESKEAETKDTKKMMNEKKQEENRKSELKTEVKTQERRGKNNYNDSEKKESK